MVQFLFFVFREKAVWLIINIKMISYVRLLGALLCFPFAVIYRTSSYCGVYRMIGL